MKLAPVLAKYLSSNKELNLPGLGTFYAENAYDPDVDYSKKGASLTNITFDQKKITGADENLINFISKETGKMKVLSESDLMSQLESVTNFLNTGKPYFFPGIGTLTKNANGTYEFHKEKYHHTEKKYEAPITEKNSVPQTYIDTTRKPRNNKPAVMILTLILLAVAATVWFYIKNSEKTKDATVEMTPAEEKVTNVATADSSSGKKPAGTSPAPQAAAPTGYKFILEKALQPRAMKRYNQLKTINWPVEIETADSINYSIYIRMPAAGTDTAKIKDSLSVLSGKKVWVER